MNARGRFLIIGDPYPHRLSILVINCGIPTHGSSPPFDDDLLRKISEIPVGAIFDRGKPGRVIVDPVLVLPREILHEDARGARAL